jgi:hypothetical protein
MTKRQVEILTLLLQTVEPVVNPHRDRLPKTQHAFVSFSMRETYVLKRPSA